MRRLSQAATAVTGGIVTVIGLSTLAVLGGSIFLWVTSATVPQPMLDLTWALVGAHLGIAIGKASRSP